MIDFLSFFYHFYQKTITFTQKISRFILSQTEHNTSHNYHISSALRRGVPGETIKCFNIFKLHVRGPRCISLFPQFTQSSPIFHNSIKQAQPRTEESRERPSSYLQHDMRLFSHVVWFGKICLKFPEMIKLFVKLKFKRICLNTVLIALIKRKPP